MTCCVASHSKDIYQSPAVGQGLLYSGFHSGPAHLAPFHLKCYRTVQPRDPSAGSSPATQAADLNSYPVGISVLPFPHLLSPKAAIILRLINARICVRCFAELSHLIV